jgi:hypothetical protein
MRKIVIALTLISLPMAARAEGWDCTFTAGGAPQHWAVSGDNLIGETHPTPRQVLHPSIPIVKNDANAVVAVQEIAPGLFHEYSSTGTRSNFATMYWRQTQIPILLISKGGFVERKPIINRYFLA